MELIGTMKYDDAIFCLNHILQTDNLPTTIEISPEKTVFVVEHGAAILEITVEEFLVANPGMREAYEIMKREEEEYENYNR